MNPNENEPRPLTAEQLRTLALQLLREGNAPRDVADGLAIDLTTLHRLVGSCIECSS
jgi:hypothetical protein